MSGFISGLAILSAPVDRKSPVFTVVSILSSLPPAICATTAHVQPLSSLSRYAHTLPHPDACWR